MVDRRVQTELHGSRAGLTADHHLTIDGRIALTNPFKRDVIAFFDEFLGDVVLDQYNLTKGSDTSPTDFAINSQIGGVARVTTGDSATVTMAGNGAQVDFGMLNFKAANDGLVFEVRAKLDIITDVAFFLGFTDQVAALEMPWTLSGTTYTSNQSDGVGFLFDTAATTDTIRCVGVKGDTDATLTDTADAWAAATWKTFRVAVDLNENATFYIDGVRVAYMASALTKTVALSPVIAGFSRLSTQTNKLDLDYLLAQMDRR